MTEKHYIKSSEFVQDCVFKRFRPKANPGILGVVKDLKEDFLEEENIGECICLLQTGDKNRSTCVRGICPLWILMRGLKELKELK